MTTSMPSSASIPPMYPSHCMSENRILFRDWSLITGMGGACKTGWGACEVLPLQKGGGGRKRFNHAETQKVLGYFLPGSLKFKPF